MKAMIIDENKNFVWTDVPEPVLADDGVIVEIHATALNRADLLQREGKYPSPEGWPSWAGLELAGRIIAVGKTTERESDFRVGDDVCALVGGGAYAERIAVPYKLLLRKPKALDYEQASTIPEAFATSYLNLFFEGKLEKGQVLYVAAGASGLASAAIPLGKAAGAYVVTSVRDRKSAEKIGNLGADEIIVEETESIPAAFERLEKSGKPVDVCMDCLAGNDLGAAMPFMARGGYWVVISTLAGVETNVKLRPLLTKGLHLVGSMLRNRTNDQKHEILQNLSRDVWKYFEDGTIKPSIYKVFDISEVEEAHAVLGRFENVGKVVLRVK